MSASRHRAAGAPALEAILGDTANPADRGDRVVADAIERGEAA